jgi:lysozyme
MTVANAACSSSDPAPAKECVGSGSDALKTCAGPTTVKGVDVSVYQGTVNWSQVKSAGVHYAFIRVSDGTGTPDTKFAANWPNAKAAGVVRGVYQYFRPGQDPNAQAKLLADKIDAAGGLQPGDLPPVLDLETADSLSSATVVARAKTWLAAVEASLGIKPIVYTAAFMSDVIGTNFGGWTLWVANYGATCPTMPSGWTEWKFWQNSDSGSVAGISGGVDTDLFNGAATDLQTLTFKSQGTTTPTTVVPEPDDTVPYGAIPNDGSQGGTIGSGNVPAAGTTAAPIDPCQ